MDTYKVFFLNHLSNYLNSLGDALSQMGHQVVYQTSWNMKEIEAGIAYFRPDFLITVGFDLPMANPSIDELPRIVQQYNLFHIYWAVEDELHFERISLPYVQRIRPDQVWTIHPSCVDRYKAHDINAQYVNFAYNPRLFPAKHDSDEETFDISFIGTTHLEIHSFRYESLGQLLFPLIKSGIRTNIWGLNWLENKTLLEQQFGTSIPPDWFHGYLPYKETSDIYRRSKIVLGVQNALDQVSQRTFDILGTGAFMIASRTNVLEHLFQDKEDIVLSSSPEETLYLIDYYLQRPEKRHRIGQRARMKVLQHHTFSHRLNNVWPTMINDFKFKGAMPL